MSVLNLNPFKSELTDDLQVPASAYDNALAIDQMEVAYASLLARKSTSVDPSELGSTVTRSLSKDGLSHPRIITYATPESAHLPLY